MANLQADLHEGAVPSIAKAPARLSLLSSHHDAMLGVLSADCASKCVLVATIPAPRWMLSAKYATIFAQAAFASLQFPALLHAGLPQVMTHVAEMGRAKAEVMSLSFAAVSTLPTEKLSAVFWTLKLPLRGTASANELHGERSLDILIEVVVVLFVHIYSTLNLTSIVRLSTLRAFEERHFCHCKCGDRILVSRIVCLGQRSSLLNNPSLQGFSAHLLIHLIDWAHKGVDTWVAHDPLAERTFDAVEGEASSTSITLPHHRLRAVLMNYVSTCETNSRCSIERLRPANGAPLISIGELVGIDGDHA